ncbi:MAG TPA: hypothetical protein VFT64_08300 [Rickettsiales bacterium]|nr:hypothetical protein [Rickettsiales bacterium]
MDKSISVELAPSNIQTLNNYKDTNRELPQYWNAWLDFAALLHDIGNPYALLSLDKEVAVPGLDVANEPDLYPDGQGRINLYDSLRKWPLLSEGTKDLIRQKIYDEVGVTPAADNPYKAVQEEGLQNVLARKWEVRQGDLFNPLGDDRVPSVEDLAGTADLNTAKFVTESNTRKFANVLHAEANKVQFSKKDGIWISAHMAGTEGYGGFLTADQIADNPDLEHEECPMSRGLLTRVMGEIVKQDPRYLGLTAAGPVPEHRRMVRPGKQYSEAVIVAGRVDYLNEQGQLKFNNGVSFTNHVRDSLLQARHVMHYTKNEAGQAVRDFVTRARQFAKKLGPLGNDSANWDRLSKQFWNKYSELNYDRPIPGDIEGLFDFIENIRDKRRGRYLDVGTGSATQYAVAAVLFGTNEIKDHSERPIPFEMEKITLSDHSESAIKWLNKELLDEYPISERTQMWVDIAKLLSTFKNKEELLAYCHKTGFDKELRNWQSLSQERKDSWFNDRRFHLSMGRGAYTGDSFLDNNIDIKATIKQLHEEGRFEIRKFDILNPPQDLIGKADIVSAYSVASCMTEKASEYCQALLNTCRLALPGGTVCASYTPYDNWKQYTAEAGFLPSISRHNYYYSVSHSMLFKGVGGHHDGVNYDISPIAKEIASVREANAAGVATFEGDEGATSLRKTGDNRFEHLINISGTPKDRLYNTPAEMLEEFHHHMLGKAQYFLLEHPNRNSIIIDSVLMRNLGELEEQMGMKPQYAPLPETQEERRERVAFRLENIIEHMENNPRSLETMDKQDAAISQFVDNIYERMVGRNPTNRMVTHTPAYAAQR